jgi:hypothetical protein
MFPVDTSGKETAWPRGGTYVPAVSRQFGCDVPGTASKASTPHQWRPGGSARLAGRSAFFHN